MKLLSDCKRNIDERSFPPPEKKSVDKRNPAYPMMPGPRDDVQRISDEIRNSRSRRRGFATDEFIWHHGRMTIDAALRTFAASVTAKMTQPITGDPEDQLRAPFEQFLKDAAIAFGRKLVCTGNTRLPDRLAFPTTRCTSTAR
jgi:hypothetical protein